MMSFSRPSSADAARPVVLVSPDLRDSVLGVARSLVDAGLLRGFVTTLGIAPPGARGLLDRLLVRAAGRSGARQTPDWLAGLVHRYPARELVRVAAQHLGFSAGTCHRVWEWAETGFDRRVARAWAGRAPCLYGCEHASVETFRRQHVAGGLNILWQVIGHHRYLSQVLVAEWERFPAPAHQTGRSVKRVNARKDEQYACADLIIANSEFVRQTFIDAGIPSGKVVAVPTGCPSVVEVSRAHKKTGLLIFLCAGTLSLRKGTHILLDAWRRLSARAGAELWLVGKPDLPAELLRELPPGVTVRPPVSRADLGRLYGQADVFVLPTFCEGRAHVVLEAVAHGLPVITTANAGCGDVVHDGGNGWIVPVGDAEALARWMNHYLEHRDEAAAHGRESMERARNWQVDDFARAHAAVVRRFLTGRGILPGSDEETATAAPLSGATP